VSLSFDEEPEASHGGKVKTIPVILSEVTALALHCEMKDKALSGLAA
jgi:hypothetical protein